MTEDTDLVDDPESQVGAGDDIPTAGLQIEPGSYERRGPGHRLHRAKSQSKKRKTRTTIASILVWGLLAGLLVYQGVNRFGSPKSAGPDQQTFEAPKQETWLLIGTSSSESEGADWLMLVSSNADSQEGLFLYLPRTTYVELPGYGQEVLAKAIDHGGETLQKLAVNNLMRISIDHHLIVSPQAIAGLVDAADGVEVQVDQALRVEGEDGRFRTVFPAGEQTLSGAEAAEYLAYSDQGDEINRGVRHLEFWRILLDQFRGEAGSLGRALSDSFGLFSTEATKAELTAFFDFFTTIEGSASRFEHLPVADTGVSAGMHFYRPETAEVEQLAKTYLAGSRPQADGAGRRIEILNGNGKPGIGRDVADELLPAGFQIVLNSNADSFDYDVTQIVVYSESKQSLAIADELKQILGVGEVLVSRLEQSLVDYTVVVGKDYLSRS